MYIVKEAPARQCCLEINLLGGFSIKVDGEPCRFNIKRSKQILLLIQYMIANRHTDIPVEQFSDILWSEHSEGDEIDNPQGALKNLVWRCRKLLRDVLPSDVASELVFFNGSTYGFNNSQPCVVDIEELERLHTTLTGSGLDIINRLVCLEKAVALYNGDFLPGFSGAEWVMVRSTYYKRIYLECVDELLSIYLGNDLYDKVITLCEIALKHERYSETIHSAYLKALAKTSQIDKAVAHYEHISTLFQRDLGVPVSPELSSFYNSMQRIDRAEVADAARIASEIDETAERTGGCYYCSYEVLKSIYRVLYRSAKRNRQCISVMIVTIHGDLNTQNVAERMEHLKNAIEASLRMTDSFTRYSANQFVVILPNVNAENAGAVTTRIRNATSLYLKRHDIKIIFDLVAKQPSQKAEAILPEI